MHVPEQWLLDTNTKSKASMVPTLPPPSLSPPGPGRLLFRGEHGGQRRVCVGERDAVPALPPGGADEHQRVQRAARGRPRRVHQEPAAQEPG